MTFTLAHLSVAYASIPRWEDTVWDQLAFAARYGHQKLPDLLRLPTTRLSRFNAALQRLIKGESGSPLHEASASGG